MKPILLITGASRGIGAATALLAAQQGWAVAVNYATNAQAANHVVQQIQDAGGTAIASVGLDFAPGPPPPPPTSLQA